MDFKNKNIAVLGFGVEGRASVEYLVKHGAIVTVLDKKDVILGIPAKGGETPESSRDAGQASMTIVTGKDYLNNLDQFDLIVRSPGIKRNLPQLSAAEKKGVGLTSQTKLFFDLCPCPIIAVTGTKGKGTTASLIYEMLKKQGFDVYLGGNIGKPPFEFLNTLTPQSKVVLELSSFQLQDLTKSPHIAVLLMVTSEHLNAYGDQNYHEDISEYVGAKRNIFNFQTPSDFSIINRDYPATNESDIHTQAQIYYVSRERDVEQGCFVRDGKVIFRTLGKLGKSENQQIRKSDTLRSPTLRRSEYSEFSETEIMNVDNVLLPGKHNLENVCAAVMAAILSGVSKKNIVSVLKSFKSLEHRLDLVREINGVRYYDDSFSTTPETAIAGIEAFDAPEILILGGSSKNSNFTQLGQTIYDNKNIKAIIGIGVEWKRIKEAIGHIPSRIQIIEGCNNMHQIVFEASELAEPGDVVLLSPACASFGMFKNYKDRGQQFKREVRALK